MKVKKTLLLLAMVSLSLSSYVKAGDEHNHVDIAQVGSSDNFNLGIEQIGYENLIRFSFSHSDNTVDLLQYGNANYIGYTDAWGSGYNWGGDLDGLDNELDIRQKCSKTSCNDNDFQFHVWGDDNVFTGSQKMDNNTISHSIIVNIYADDNEVFARQAQNGNKSLTLTINNDGNDVYINQRDNGAHTATITLTGSFPTDLSLTQKGNTTQSYSLTQNCLTASGCNVSVTQQ